MYPSFLIAGALKAKLVIDDPELIARNLYGEIIEYGRPPVIKIRVKDNGLPGDTLFHELAHLVEAWIGKDFLPQKQEHNIFLSAFYLSLKQNGFLATCLISGDFE